MWSLTVTSRETDLTKRKSMGKSTEKVKETRGKKSSWGHSLPRREVEVWQRGVEGRTVRETVRKKGTKRPLLVPKEVLDQRGLDQSTSERGTASSDSIMNK